MVLSLMPPRRPTRVPTDSDATFLRSARVGRLATADAQGTPSCVPVVYAFDGQRIYIPIDRKPKQVEPSSLKRVRDIMENPRVALVVDHYTDDWALLRYLMVRGRATYGALTDEALHLLRDKYAQYQVMEIDALITIEPEKFIGWKGAEA